MSYKRQLQLRMLTVFTLLIILTIGFAATLGFLLGSYLVAILIVTIATILQLKYSKPLALKSVNATPVTQDDEPTLHEIVTRLSLQADIEPPEIAIAQTQTPNAFVTGIKPSNTTLCITEGLLKELDQDEIEAVIAHEIAHIKNRDATVMTLASSIVVLAGIILRYSFYTNPNNSNAKGYAIFLLVSMITYAIGYLLIRALSRFREYAADHSAAQLTGNPTALATALRKIDTTIDNTPDKDLREINAANALMISPTTTKLLSTHPKTEKRINRLQQLTTNQ